MNATTAISYSGQPLDFACPNPVNIRVEDLAISLSRAPRFCGHLHIHTWSVLQHSILMASFVDPDKYRLALAHDASEAFLCDLPGPVKHMPELAGYRRVEARVQKASLKALGIQAPPEALAEIKLADRLSEKLEAISFGCDALKQWARLQLPEAGEPSTPLALCRNSPDLWVRLLRLGPSAGCAAAWGSLWLSQAKWGRRVVQILLEKQLVSQLRGAGTGGRPQGARVQAGPPRTKPVGGGLGS